MHFLLVLACDAHCLAYFPYAYRGLYFVLVIVYFYVLLLLFVYCLTYGVFGVLWVVHCEYSGRVDSVRGRGMGGGAHGDLERLTKPVLSVNSIHFTARKCNQVYRSFQGHYRIKPLPAHCTVLSPDVVVSCLSVLLWPQAFFSDFYPYGTYYFI
jgi:hypothetical protein